MNNSINIKIQKASLLDALGKVLSVVQNRNTIEILNNVKLDVEDDKLTITATDMDISACESILVDSEADGTLTINARKLFDIIRKTPDDEDIAIRGDADNSGKVQIKSKGCKFTLPCLKSSDFPIITKDNLPCNFKIAANDFVNIINKTKFAACTDEGRYSLSGVSLKVLDNNLIATSTNAAKLAKVTMPVELSNFPNILLPLKTIATILKIFNNPAIELDIAISDSKIAITQGGASIISKLIDAKFPDTDRTFPNILSNELTINRELLIKTIDRVSLAADAKKNQITIIVEDGSLIASAKDTTGEEAEGDIKIESSALTLKRSYNYKFLLEILSNIENENITLYFNKKNEPLYISNKQSCEYYLLMPMHG